MGYVQNLVDHRLTVQPSRMLSMSAFLKLTAYGAKSLLVGIFEAFQCLRGGFKNTSLSWNFHPRTVWDQQSLDLYNQAPIFFNEPSIDAAAALYDFASALTVSYKQLLFHAKSGPRQHHAVHSGKLAPTYGSDTDAWLRFLHRLDEIRSQNKPALQAPASGLQLVYKVNDSLKSL
ncbi:MAG: hypothetical protein R3C41_14710 [Calditrichia bacterium]